MRMRWARGVRRLGRATTRPSAVATGRRGVVPPAVVTTLGAVPSGIRAAACTDLLVGALGPFGVLIAAGGDENEVHLVARLRHSSASC